jgi:hypothetical protein
VKVQMLQKDLPYFALLSTNNTLSFFRTRIEIYEHLHPHYSTLVKRWCSIGAKLGAPSLRVVNLPFKQSHYLDETVVELGKLISSIAPDNTIFQFWKLNTEMREFLAVGEKLRYDCAEQIRQGRSEVDSFKKNENVLKSLEMQDESEYPENLLELFKTKENFQPSRPKDLCVLIARNLHHWRSCGSSHIVDPAYNSPESTFRYFNCTNLTSFLNHCSSLKFNYYPYSF